jgi:hypothetical protein
MDLIFAFFLEMFGHLPFASWGWPANKRDIALLKSDVKLREDLVLTKLGSAEEVTNVDEVPDVETVAVTRAALMRVICWIMGAILIGGFAFMMMFSLLNPGKPVPESVQNIVMAVLGYFGGAFTAFMGLIPASSGLKRGRARP